MGERRGLRVLITAESAGAVFPYAIVLARELAARGAEVHVATMGGPLRAAQRFAARAVLGTVVHESAYALEWQEDPWEDVDRAGQWLLALEREIRPDVVHLNSYAHGNAGFRAPVVVTGHACVLSFWEAVLGERAPTSWDRYRARVTDGIRAARAVIAPSRAMLDALERHYGPLSEPTVVHDGLPPPPRGSTRREPFVLAAGRVWDPAKNLSVLERVAPRLAWPIRVAGSDERPDGTRHRLEGVDALGWLSADALGREMDRAGIFVHPARYEPFGLGPLEAAQRGCALVLGDIPSLREIWEDAATFVPPDDEAALAAALAELATDDVLRARMQVRARTQADRYGAAEMARKTLAAYARAGVPVDHVIGGDQCAS